MNSETQAYRVLITDYPWGDLSVEREELGQVSADLVTAASSGPEALIEAVRDVDAIMACWTPLSAEVIDAAARCRMIARLGIGLDNIDVVRCTERGIRVTNVPDYCIDEVAEHTMALLLASARNIVAFAQAARQGQYGLSSGPPMHRLRGRRLGVVGLGRIGRRVADLAMAIGLDVVAHTRTPRKQFRCVELDELLGTSDFVTLHLPLTDATRHLIGAREFELMKPHAVLINTARGALVDHQALAAALANNAVGGAALDVQSPEPPPLNQMPYNDSRVLVTPHAAFVSEESVAELRRRAAQQVVTHLRGDIPPNVVNGV